MRNGSIFNPRNDKFLQDLIKKREQNRAFITEVNEDLFGIDDTSEPKKITFQYYVEKCDEILKKLQSFFPAQCSRRIEYYNGISEVLHQNYNEYCESIEDVNSPLSIETILKYTDINIDVLLDELIAINPNEVILYKMKKDLTNTLQNSTLLKSLRFIFI